MAQATSKKMELQSALRSCRHCGAFRGEIVMPGQERALKVSCRCLDGHCPRCKRRLVTTPFSRSCDDVEGRVWHAPHLGAHCPNCGPLFLMEQGSEERYDG
jgi:hypothetical protein